MAPLIEIDALPKLRDPVLVVALSGWVDAGIAGAGTVAVLHEQAGARQFGRVDLADLIDLQQTRPSVHLVDGVSRQISWPEISLSAGNAGRDVVLCVGPEPSLRWRAVLGAIVELAQQLGVKKAFTVAGIPSMASHRRPVMVRATATDAELVADAGAWRQDYSGPTGAQSALQVMLGDGGIPTIGLWAQVPHYVAGGASPPAIRSLLARLRELAALQIDLSTLDEQMLAYTSRVEEGLAERPDVVDVINAIESGVDESEPLPSGDELASEIERFLRGQ
jgi:proteasome assembly chaperone (PAC2) family protein